MDLSDIRLPPKWIELNICKRECCAFIPSGNENSDICQCGKRKFEHDDVVKVIRNPDIVWNPAIHTRSLPTDAYGTLIFEGDHHSTKAHFCRLSYDTHPETVLQLLTLVWGLEMPKLVITVRGGHSDFELSARLGKILQNGLIKAAQATGAWITTGGVNEGVTKHVGNVLSHERAVLGMRKNKLVTIGIAPWGVVAGREDLRVRNKNVSYSCIDRTGTVYRSLNSRHSNFLLVDNGSTGKVGGEHYFRRRMSKTISSYPTSLQRGCHIPVVCLVIEGGFSTLRNIGDFLNDEPPTPVIIFGGSGRTADLIAWVLHRLELENSIEDFKDEIYKHMNKIYHVNEAQCNTLFKEIKRIIAKKSLVTVYNCHSTNNEDFDVVILASLFRSQHWSPLQQLSLSMLWDRVDIARNEVFVYGREFSKDNLEHAMMQALVFDRLEFVSLLLEHGLNMAKFLTPDRLEILYSYERKESEVLYMLVSDLTKNRVHKKSDAKSDNKKPEPHNSASSLDTIITLHEIGITMSHMMGHIFKSRYNLIPSSRNSDDGGESCSGLPGICLHPFDDLFIWAVLTLRHGMAVLLWRHGEGALAKALVAVKLNKYMAQALEITEKMGDGLVSEIREYAEEWESLAYELLDICFKQDQKRARQLLTMELERWSNMTCLNLAVIAHHQMLLGHTCCQMLLRDLWMGALNVKNNGTLKILAAIFFPPLILTLDYKSTEELKLLPHENRSQHGVVQDTNDTRISGGKGGGGLHDAGGTYGSKSQFTLRTTVQNPREIHAAHATPPSSEKKDVEHRHRSVTFHKEEKDAKTRHSQDKDKQDTFTIRSNSKTEIVTLEPIFHSSEISIPLDLKENRSQGPLHRRKQGRDRSSFVTTTQKLGTWSKIVEFQKAPVTNFMRHAISYILFVMALSYTILIPQNRYKAGYVEIYVIACLATQGCDVIRDFFAINAFTWSQKWVEFRGHIWQICDFVMVMFFMVGVGLRFSRIKDGFEYGMLIYRVSSIYWNLRIYKYMGVHRFVGPKIVMMSKMLKHMAYFALIIFVVIFAFGLAREAIRFPNTMPTWRNIAEGFLEPYVMMFGEVDTESLAPQCGMEDQPDCPYGYWVIPLTWVVYMMVANILIVNVLIAVFNGIYSEIDSVAVQVWMFQRFNFVMEFEQKPLLGPPLIVISHLWGIIVWFYGRLRSCLCEQEMEVKYEDEDGPRIIVGNDHRLKIFLSHAESTIVFDFEEDCQEMFTSSKISRFLVGGNRNETADVLMAKLTEGNISSDILGGGDRMGLQHVRLTLREIFTELETHRTKLDKLIDNFEEKETAEVFLDDDNGSSRESSADDDD